MEELNLFNGTDVSSAEKKSNLIHYEGELGCFDYDSEDYELITDDNGDYLHYRERSTVLNLPKGITNTRKMFQWCTFTEDFTLGDKTYLPSISFKTSTKLFRENPLAILSCIAVVTIDSTS